MTVDDRFAEQWSALRAARGRVEAGELPLFGGGGGGTSDGMEPRIAKLEALMEATRSDLAKLATLPADVAGIKERLTHIGTKAETRTELDGIVDRAVRRVQVTVGLSAGVLGLAGTVLHFWK